MVQNFIYVLVGNLANIEKETEITTSSLDRTNHCNILALLPLHKLICYYPYTFLIFS